MLWLFLIVASLTIAWLASTAVRKQKHLNRIKYQATLKAEPLIAEEGEAR
jgi:hypothetical protein